MKRLAVITLVATMLFGGIVHAEVLNTNGLTPQQVADINATIATKKAENVKSGAEGVVEVLDNLDAEDVERYAEIGKVVSTTIKDTASGLGIAVDEFVNTGTGTLVMFLIVYHFFGSEILSFLIGFIFVMPLTLWLSRRFLRGVKTKGYSEPDEKGKQHIIFKTELKKNESETVGWIYALTMLAIIIQLFMFLP